MINRVSLFISLFFFTFNTFATSIFFNKIVSADLIKNEQKQAINNQIGLLEPGILALKAGQFILAEKIAAQTVAGNTNDFNAHLLLLFSYLGQGKNQTLLQYLQNIKIYKPSFSSALHLNLAQYFYQNHQYFRALEQLIELGDEESFVIQKYKLYAQVYQAQKRIDLAIEYYKKVLEMIPAEQATVLELARLSLVKNNYKAAKYYAKKVIEQQSENREGYFILGIANLLNNNISQAYSAFNTLKKLSLDDDVTESYRAICLTLLNKNQQAKDLVDNLQKQELKPPIEFSFIKALLALKNNQNPSLLKAINEIKHVNKNDPLLYVFSAAYTAKAAQQSKSYYSDLSLASDLIVDFADEEKLKTQYPISVTQLALLAEVALFYRQGLHKTIIEKLSQNKEALHFSVRIYYSRAYWQLNQANLAIEAYKNIIEDLPNLTAARLELADIYYFQQKGELAITLYQQVVSEQPKNYKVMIRLANLYNSLGFPNEAIEYYKKVLDKNPDAYIYNQLAGTYSEKLNDYKVALTYAKLGDAEDKSQSIVKDTLADIYFNLGQYQAAMDIYLPLIELTKNTFPATTYYNIAKNYDALNQSEQASMFYELALNTGYDFDYVKQAEQRLYSLWR